MSNCSNTRHQRGDALLEALVSVLITGLIAGGMMHLAARAMDSQRETKVQRLVVEQARNQLQAQGLALCGTTPSLQLPDGLDPAAEVKCPDVTPIALGLDGENYTVTPPRPVSIEVTAADLGLSGAGNTDDAGPPLTVGTQQ